MGDQDDWIPPERAACGFDRLEANGAALTVCIVPGATHDPVIGMRAAYVNRWIAARTLGRAGRMRAGARRLARHERQRRDLRALAAERLTLAAAVRANP